MQPIIFPHDNLRPIQKELVNDIYDAIKQKRHIIAHAPTGLGKTAASLAPALSFALENNLTIFFLTSRHTQHKIVLDTMRILKQKYNQPISTSSIIAKKSMCALEGISAMHPNDFIPYCKHLRENNECTNYLNSKSKIYTRGKALIAELINKSPIPIEEVIQEAKEAEICPYETAINLASKARVIISDYMYIFHPRIRESFLKKISKELEKSIIIIDEGHNLPERLRDMMTTMITSRIIQRAIKEAKEAYADNLTLPLVELLEALNKLAQDVENEKEKKTTKEAFMQELKRIANPEQLIPQLKLIAETIRDEKKQSSLGTIAEFLEQWPHGEQEFVRVISKKKENIILKCKCLDPSINTREVLEKCHSAILMSGTLVPTAMYADVLGFKTFVQKEYPSPFPSSNKLAIIIPQTTTKFSMRTEQQYKEIAKICSQITNTVNGNIAIFFPSYYLRDQINNYFSELCKKTILLEHSEQSKEEKQQLLQKFTDYKNIGAVLMGVASGSFGEGIDLPGVIKCIIVVGLPLDRPDLETNSLIEYYDQKFGKGWDYGYTLPAITKTLQNAGRCIRSEKDKGALIFLEERYSWPRYRNCFPKDWNIKITNNYLEEIKIFFA